MTDYREEAPETTLVRTQMHEDAMSEAEAGEGGAHGDPRRCPRHPNEKTSSADGMFDAPCGACEASMDDLPCEGEGSIASVLESEVAEMYEGPVVFPDNVDDLLF